MSPAARSVFAFGVYLAVVGLALLLVPEVACRLVGLTPPAETVWGRLCGMVILDLAFYCTQAARREELAFIRRTTLTRPCFCLVLAALVVCGLARPVILAFGLVDVLAAAWTARALRASGTTP